MFSIFFFNDTATTEIYTLSLHDALPIYLKLGVRFGKCDFVGSSINCEKEVALPNNVPVLEKYSSKRTAYLRAQFDLRNRRELAKEAQPRIDVLRQRLAHHDLWKCRRRSTGGTSPRPRRILEPCPHKP